MSKQSAAKTFALVRIENSFIMSTFTSAWDRAVGERVQLTNGKWGKIILKAESENMLRYWWNSIIGYANFRIKARNKAVRSRNPVQSAETFNQELWSDIFTYIELGADFNDLINELQGN